MLEAGRRGKDPQSVARAAARKMELRISHSLRHPSQSLSTSYHWEVLGMRPFPPWAEASAFPFLEGENIEWIELISLEG